MRQERHVSWSGAFSAVLAIALLLPSACRDGKWRMDYRGTLPADAVRYLCHDYGVCPRTLDFSRNGRFLASLSNDYQIAVWETASGRQVIKMQGHLLALSPDGETVAVGSVMGGHRFELWSLASGTKLRTLRVGDEDAADALAFSPDGRLLAGAGLRSVRIWNPVTGEEIQRFETKAGRITSLMFSPDGKALAAGDTSLAVHLWDLSTGKLRRVRAGSASEDCGSVNLLGFAPGGGSLTFHRDVRYSDSDCVRSHRTTAVWNTETGEEVLRLPGAAVLSSDGAALVSNAGDSPVPAKPQNSPGESAEQMRIFMAVSAAPEEEFAFRIPGAPDGKIRIWDTGTGKLRHMVESFGPFALQAGGGVMLTGARAAVPWYVMMGNGRGRPRIVDHTVVCYDLASGAETRRMTVRADDNIHCMALSPDGRVLIGERGAICAWRMPAGEEIAKLTYIPARPGGPGMGSGHTIAFSLDSSYLVMDIEAVITLVRLCQ